MTVRVQKVLSQWGIASRRKAEKMILAGRVEINGRTAKLGDKTDLTVDSLKVDGKSIEIANRPQSIYLLLNKPTEVVSTCSDPQNRSTVIDLLPVKFIQGTGIHPVGRLDYASSGALILTNDGDLTLGLTHPRYHLSKVYWVELDRPPSLKDLNLWSKGVMLDDKKTLPAKIKQLNQNNQQTIIEVTLTEGRNRQIRRVANKLGYQVQKLHRMSIGSINLESGKSKIAKGQYRHLDQAEITFLKNSCNIFGDLKTPKLAAQSRSAVHDH